MITPAYAQSMSAYNAEMNRRFYAAARNLSDEARRQDRGAFWHSIHGTLSHLLWVDLAWMARFTGSAMPPNPLAKSDEAFPDFGDLDARRASTDAQIAAWAERLTPDWLLDDQTWFSGAVQRELKMPRTMLLMHLFNHQTHHRGQVHALLTAAGEKTGDTDVLLVLGAI